MENPATWSPLCKAINFFPTWEAKEILDHLIEEKLVPADPYWEMIEALSDAISEQERDIEEGVYGGSMGRKAEHKIQAVLRDTPYAV